MNKLFALLCLFVFLSPAHSWAGKAYRVVVFADSVMGGYQLQAQDTFAAKLQKKIQSAGYDQIEVVNLSTLDATTAAATAEAAKVAPELPDVIIVQLGFNDAKRGVVTTATAFNLHNILQELKQTGAYIILVGIVPPAGTNVAYYNDTQQVYYSVAKNNGVALYPNAMQGISSDPAFTLADGMHPNTVGVERMVEALFPFVDTGLRWRYQVYQQELQRTKDQNTIVP